MITINPAEIDPLVLQNYLQSAIAPRPIAWVSTVNIKGEINLAPFSFFNIFGISPPILVFSPNNRLRDGSTKHTLANVKEVPELVVHMVSFDHVNQMSLSSSEYKQGVNEFQKAGISSVPSKLVKPPSIEFASVKMECKVLEIKSYGSEKGKTNLVICEVLLIHIAEELLDKNGHIDVLKTDWVARGGGNFYIRANNFFEVAKPSLPVGVGVDQIPVKLRSFFSGNELGILGLIPQLPDENAVEDFRLAHFGQDFIALTRTYLAQNNIEQAWKALLCVN